MTVAMSLLKHTNSPVKISSLRMFLIFPQLSTDQVYLSFVGIGVDFNSDMADKFAHVKGCNTFWY